MADSNGTGSRGDIGSNYSEVTASFDWLSSAARISET